jgi:hypothetical protein
MKNKLANDTRITGTPFEGPLLLERACASGKHRMRMSRNFAVLVLIFLSVPTLSAQDKKPANDAAAPPNVVLLVNQDFPAGKAAERQKFLVNISRACDRLGAPSYWIDLQSLTGTQQAISFDPFDSYEQVGQANAEWRRFFAAHPDLARMQDGIDALLLNQRTSIAVRRDDLGYLAEAIDLSEARYMRVHEIHLFPGHENDAAEAFKILADAYAKIQADTPWVVYEVNVGMPSPTFVVFLPMSELRQNDDLLAWNLDLMEAEGEQGRDTLQRIAREAYATTESNLYAVSPEMSHVSKDFAGADPDFWLHHEAPDAKPDPKPDPKATAKRSNK